MSSTFMSHVVFYLSFSLFVDLGKQRQRVKEAIALWGELNPNFSIFVLKQPSGPDKWKKIGPMQLVRSHAFACVHEVLFTKGGIFVPFFGGS